MEHVSWSEKRQLGISSSKCPILHIGKHNPKAEYTISNKSVSVCDSAKDLGIVISNDLKFSSHCKNITNSAYRVANLLLKRFYTSDPVTLMRAYSSYVRPILEYCSCVWSPVFVSDIDMIERVQRFFTRRVFGRCGLAEASYINRLEALKLDSLELRRLHNDLVMMYKCVHGDVDISFDALFTYVGETRTRGHALKLRKPKPKTNCLSHSFIYRNVETWNRLPEAIDGKSVVYSGNSKIFKDSISKIDFSSYLKFGRNL